jgi:hypothetical protein
MRSGIFTTSAPFTISYSSIEDPTVSAYPNCNYGDCGYVVIYLMSSNGLQLFDLAANDTLAVPHSVTDEGAGTCAHGCYIQVHADNMRYDIVLRTGWVAPFSH